MLAGIGGDSHYVKQDFEIQLNKSLLLDSVGLFLIGECLLINNLTHFT